MAGFSDANFGFSLAMLGRMVTGIFFFCPIFNLYLHRRNFTLIALADALIRPLLEVT